MIGPLDHDNEDLEDSNDYKLPLPHNLQINSVVPNADDNNGFGYSENSNNGHQSENNSKTSSSKNGKEFPCYFKFCNKAFISEVCLKKHLILFHNQEQEEEESIGKKKHALKKYDKFLL